MGTPPPADSQRQQQRRPLMTRMLSQQETYHGNTPTSPPLSPQGEADRSLEWVSPLHREAMYDNSDSPGGSDPVPKRRLTTVKFLEPPSTVRDSLVEQTPIDQFPSSPRLSKGQTNAYFKRLEKVGEALRLKRTALSRSRAVLAHQESIEKSKLEYLQESINLFYDLLLARQKGMPDDDELRRGLDTLRSDRSAYDNQLAELKHYRADVSKRESTVQHLEARLDRVLLKLRHRLVDEEDEKLSVISDESRHSLQQDNMPQPVDSEIDKFLEKLGDRRILMEEFLEVEAERNEEHGRWELLTEQERPVSPGYARRTDATYSARQEELRDALRQADDAVLVAYERCLVLELNPDQYITDPRLTGADHGSETSQDPTGESSGIYYVTEPTTYDPGSAVGIAGAQISSHYMLNRTLFSPIPKSPNPQGSQRVETWLNTLRSQLDDETPSDILIPDATERGSRPVSATGQTLEAVAFNLQSRETERHKAAAQSALDEILASMPGAHQDQDQSPQIAGHTEGQHENQREEAQALDHRPDDDSARGLSDNVDTSSLSQRPAPHEALHDNHV
ncbi:hypothetical protein AMS68_000233 [Peltaster fructicola]|uniref:Uncharacterized protein n=1 Tax=Peltaster fructicola TaxID=286661 RepID=A0A6H0XJ25_9PEZI|nr:hypothetical protein AMS68_000233 [Peltaster fructicola]